MRGGREPRVLPYAGKGQGEVSLLRRLWDVLRPGDVIAADRLTANWANVVFLRERGVELVSRLNKAHRPADFRRGHRPGPEDHVVRWPKPTSIRSLDWQTYRAPTESITVREARVRVAQPGFRTKSVIAVTTLLDPRRATKGDLAELYRARWHAEKTQADCPSSRRWVCPGWIGYHRRGGVARTGRVVPATARQP